MYSACVPHILSAATCPCFIAFGQIPERPVTSPAAKIFGQFVSMVSETWIKRSTWIGVSRAHSTAGRTPAATITRSQSIFVPSSRRTKSIAPDSFICVSDAFLPRRNLQPCDSNKVLYALPAVSFNWIGRMRSAISTTVTSFPCSKNAYAASMPTNPEPTTRMRFAWSARGRIACASDRWRSPKTLLASRNCPTGGIKLFAPVAISRRS